MSNIKILNPEILDSAAIIGAAINNGVPASSIDKAVMHGVDLISEKFNLTYKDRADLMYASKNVMEQICELAWIARQ